MKKSIRTICLGLLITSLTSSVVYGKSFKDMPNNWARKPLERAVERKVLVGDGDYIRPNDKLERAQMAAMVNRILDLSISADLSNYEDMDPSKWYYDDMAKVIGLGLMDIDGDLVHPNKDVTREEAFVIIGRALNLKSGSEAIEFKDHNKITEKYLENIYGMRKYNLIRGYEDNSLNPKGSLSRAEFAQLIDNTYNLLIKVRDGEEIKESDLININKSEGQKKFDKMANGELELKGRSLPYKASLSKLEANKDTREITVEEAGGLVTLDICLELPSENHSLGINRVVKVEDGYIIIEPKIVEGSKGVDQGVHKTLRLELKSKDLGRNPQFKIRKI